MTNLKSIENKINQMNKAVDTFAYNFDRWQYEAEKLILSGARIVSEDEVKSHINHISKFLVNFDQLTEKEQEYYASVGCARGLAVSLAN